MEQTKQQGWGCSSVQSMYLVFLRPRMSSQNKFDAKYWRIISQIVSSSRKPGYCKNLTGTIGDVEICRHSVKPSEPDKLRRWLFAL